MVFLATGDIAYLPMFLGTPLYLVVLMIFARNYARGVTRHHRCASENVELISQLRDQTRAPARAQREAAGSQPGEIGVPGLGQPTTCASRCMRWGCSWSAWAARNSMTTSTSCWPISRPRPRAAREMLGSRCSISRSRKRA